MTLMNPMRSIDSRKVEWATTLSTAQVMQLANVGAGREFRMCISPVEHIRL